MSPSTHQWDRIGQTLAATTAIMGGIGFLMLTVEFGFYSMDDVLGDTIIGAIPAIVSLSLLPVAFGLALLTRWIAAKHSSYDVEWFGP